MTKIMITKLIVNSLVLYFFLKKVKKRLNQFEGETKRAALL